MAEQVLAEWSQVAVCTYKSAGGTKTWLQTKRGEDGVAHLGCALCVDPDLLPVPMHVKSRGHDAWLKGTWLPGKTKLQARTFGRHSSRECHAYALGSLVKRESRTECQRL